MPITRLSPEQLKEFDQMVQQTAMKFPGEVIRIRYSFGDDWYDPAIFFRILLADDTRRDDQFVNITSASRTRYTTVWDRPRRSTGRSSRFAPKPSRINCRTRNGNSGRSPDASRSSRQPGAWGSRAGMPSPRDTHCLLRVVSSPCPGSCARLERFAGDTALGWREPSNTETCGMCPEPFTRVPGKGGAPRGFPCLPN